MRISLIIPALNEADSICAVLAAIPPGLADEILVVDGCSTDGTPELAEAAGARVLHEARRGYGQACATGLAEAQGDIVVFMDADGADDPLFLPVLVAPLLQNQAELVLGSRLAGSMDAGAMPWHQVSGNWLSARLIRGFYGLPITDLSPFRAVLRDRLLRLDMKELTFGWPTEMITKAARQGWRIVEVPVAYHHRIGGKSKISGTLRGSALASYMILRVILRNARR